MNQKIINPGEGYPEVLIYKDKNDADQLIVIIQSWQKDSDEEDDNDYAQFSEVIEFENNQSAKAFIRDYSVESAKGWCDFRSLKYQ